MNLSVFVFYLSLCLSYLLIRPLATLVHECGHLCYLLLIRQKGEITVYLGSLGEGKSAWRIKTGRIRWIVHPIGILMRGSLCDFRQPLKNAQIVPFALAGPLFSLILAGCAAFLAFGSTISDTATWSKPLLILAALIPLIDFFLALFYTYSPIQHSSETVFGNDGQLITWRIRYKKQTANYLHAWWLFEKERYAEAWDNFQQVLDRQAKSKLFKRDKEIVEHLIFCALMLKKHSEVIVMHSEMAKFHSVDPFDVCRFAAALEALGEREKAKTALNDSLKSTPGHFEALNFRAYFYIQDGNLEEAAQDLRRSIQSNKEFAVAYNNLAGLFLLKSDPDNAYKNLILSMKYEAENPELHRYWAIYHQSLGNIHEANEALERARLLGMRNEKPEGFSEAK